MRQGRLLQNSLPQHSHLSVRGWRGAVRRCLDRRRRLILSCLQVTCSFRLSIYARGRIHCPLRSFTRLSLQSIPASESPKDSREAARTETERLFARDGTFYRAEVNFRRLPFFAFMALRIEDYAMIGDCQTAALVGKDGSIDWLCFPRFDSPACFAALLGTPEHGRWKIAPTGEMQAVRRRYRGGTLVLETDFETSEGEVRLIDCMPPRSTSPDLVGLVEGCRGRVPMRLELIVRFDYGSIVPWVRHIDRGIRAVAGPDTLYCRTDVELRGENLHTVADFTVAAGQRVSC